MFVGLGLVLLVSPLIASSQQPVTEYVGPACRVFEMNLRYGLTDADAFSSVSDLQQILIDQGYLNIEAPTGYFGRLTFRAVKVLQADNDIPNTGFVGILTRGFLNSLPCRGGNTTTFSASPSSGPAPLAVNFSYSTKSLSGDANNYSIEFGDGQSTVPKVNCFDGVTVWRCDFSAEHIYSSAGTYTAKLIYQPPYVCNPLPGGACATIAPAPKVIGTVTITVTGGTQSTFSASPTSGPAPLTVTFTAPFSKLDLNVYSIDFGDGQSQSFTNGTATHKYTKAGTYKALLTIFPELPCPLGAAKTDCGPRVIGTAVITVGEPSTSTFSASPTSGTAPLSVEFSAKSISPSYRIYFGDGQKYMFTANDTPECVAPPPGSTYDPDYCTTWRTSHTYTAAGTYTATLSYQPTCTAPQDAVCMLAPEEVRGTVTITVTSPATPTGTLSVSTDPSSPAYSLAVAGTSGVTLGAFRFSAKGEDVRLDRVGISLADSAYSGDITQLTLWDGGSLVATAVITGSKLIAISTAFSNFTIPRDSSRLLTIKGDLAAIGVGQPGRAGDLVRVNITSDTYGIGVSSGSSIQLGSSGEQSAGVRVFRTVPTVARITPPSSALIAQTGVTLYQFSIKADAANDLAVYQLTPVILVSTASEASGETKVSNLKIYAYTDPSFTSGAPGFVDGQVAATIPTVSNGRNAVVMSSPLVIPRGGTYYFKIVADITQKAGTTNSAGTVVTSLAGDPSYAFGTASQISGSAFVWSPLSIFSTASPNNSDWTNGFGVPGLPSSWTDPVTLSKQ